MPMPASSSRVYALLGLPVAGNPTGRMVEAACTVAGVDARYVSLDVLPQLLPAAIGGVRALGFHGAHVTKPHKIAVVPLLERLTRSAETIGAVNCIRREGSELAGDNTDGKGFLSSLSAVRDPSGQRVVVFGAGGAARAIAVELALAGAARVDVVNRSPEPARELARVVAAASETASGVAELGARYRLDRDVSIAVNATSVGMLDPDEALPIDWSTAPPGLIAADVVITPGTRFLHDAAAAGCATLDGLGMLVEQAVVGLRWWLGIEADRAAMRAAVEDALGLR